MALCSSVNRFQLKMCLVFINFFSLLFESFEKVLVCDFFIFIGRTNTSALVVEFRHVKPCRAMYIYYLRIILLPRHLPSRPPSYLLSPKNTYIFRNFFYSLWYKLSVRRFFFLSFFLSTIDARERFIEFSSKHVNHLFVWSFSSLCNSFYLSLRYLAQFLFCYQLVQHY